MHYEYEPERVFLQSGLLRQNWLKSFIFNMNKKSAKYLECCIVLIFTGSVGQMQADMTSASSCIEANFFRSVMQTKQKIILT